MSLCSNSGILCYAGLVNNYSNIFGLRRNSLTLYARIGSLYVYVIERIKKYLDEYGSKGVLNSVQKCVKVCNF